MLACAGVARAMPGALAWYGAECDVVTMTLSSAAWHAAKALAKAGTIAFALPTTSSASNTTPV
jgi:hypothetical protein